ncbi:ScbA/BarX family gamma-butyrolactone biosynthesis protein [Streptomyces sp. TRM49041]|uniref:ScbA/BarX family gamma-butyrolactone biosynthesis protein n=1 Tax=Streptomyces sp. TRM49041 TaxID=2603216 RepID=UPI0011EC99D1|nr:ScbA/BarX family gamma-butyrolactone biosynthesis protein [Streptomyces sp. TRM49041]
MTAVVESDGVEAALSRLGFERTVPRGLVHRRALSEVFLTDSRMVAATSFVAAAQLPPSHAYYTDHTAAHAVDPLLLLECCRQAETHAVHAHFGAPIGTKFVLESWDMDLPGAAAVGGVTGPAELLIRAETYDARWVGGALRGLGYRMRLSMDGARVGEVTMRVKYVADTVYGALRGRKGSGPLPTSDAYREPLPPGLAAPARVGRVRAENVILLDPAVGEHEVRAGLRVAGGHPSLFDHAQDHVPGMVLMEAGRQAGLLAAEESTGVPAAEWGLTGMSAAFRAYAELDEPLVVVARGGVDGAGDSGGDGDGLFGVRVLFEQGGRGTAEAGFRFVRRR